VLTSASWCEDVCHAGNRKLLAQSFIALVVMTGEHSRFEDGVLDVLGQLSPAFEYASASARANRSSILTSLPPQPCPPRPASL